MKTEKIFHMEEKDGNYVETVQTSVILDKEELLKYIHNLPVRIQQVEGKINQLKNQIKEQLAEKELVELESDYKKVTEQLGKAKKLAEPILKERKEKVTKLVKEAKTDKGFGRARDATVRAKLRAHIMADICATNPDWNRGDPWLEEIVVKELS